MTIIDDDKFIDDVKKLYFINRSQLPEMSDRDWLAFISDPAKFLIQTNVLYQNAIMRQLKGLDDLENQSHLRTVGLHERLARIEVRLDAIENHSSTSLRK